MGYDLNKYNTSVADYELWALAHREKEAPKTSRFITLSAAFHAAALIAVAVMAVPLAEEVKTETITIELEDIKPVPQFSRGVNVPATQGPAPAPAPKVEEVAKAEKVSAEDVVVPSALPAKLPEKALPAKAEAKPVIAKAPKAAAKVAAAPIHHVAPKTNFKAVPMTIDDIEAPELENGDFAKTPVAAADLSDDLNKDFSKVDEKNADELENQKREMDNMAAALASEQDENLKGVQDDNEAEQERMNQAQENLREKNAAAVASAVASERAAAESAARQQAARDAAAAAAQREAAARKARADAIAAARGNGLGEKEGLGAGNNGNSNIKSAALAGSPTGVRSLDQLRQMPGNPRPQYDRAERLRGDQGEIAFVAYISKEGYPTQFRMMKSTGFRNLDAKTLSALKKWRFYPGQEGWVELPFRWDLKGGVQEDGGLLRRAVSAN